MLLSPTFTKCFKISVGRKLTSNNVEQTSVKSISPERQSARMSKITNDSLTRSGTGCTHMATAGVKGLIKFNWTRLTGAARVAGSEGSCDVIRATPIRRVLTTLYRLICSHKNNLY